MQFLNRFKLLWCTVTRHLYMREPTAIITQSILSPRIMSLLFYLRKSEMLFNHISKTSNICKRWQLFIFSLLCHSGLENWAHIMLSLGNGDYVSQKFSFSITSKNVPMYNHQIHDSSTSVTLIEGNIWDFIICECITHSWIKAVSH